LLLARDFVASRRGIDCRNSGVRELGRPVVFCSDVAHFSLHRACAALGLGERAVRPISVTASRTMDPGALVKELGRLEEGETPVAIVATAGTTDFGTVDPLRELAGIAREHGIWFHVDAAYGFGALFSRALAHCMDGISLADSITLDLHKLGWQPAAASVLLVSPDRSFSSLSRSVDYLNPADDAEAGFDGLLGNSLQTTRRADAIKVAATLLAYGRRGLGEMVDACHTLARHAEKRVRFENRLTLEAPAELTTVVFRYRAMNPPTESGANRGEFENQLNAELRRTLLQSGRALIGRTTLRDTGPERICLKLTLINPNTTTEQVDALMNEIVETGKRCEMSLRGSERNSR
ncbi:MAG: pyridoxal-dependent decarboxylase, partial [Myxococcota bacterium]